MLNTPFPPWPAFSEEEAQAVARVLLSNRVNYWTGEECRSFETEFAAWCGVAHAVSLSNGTVALEVALRALGVGPGDEVVVTPRSFMASASCVVSVGAVPVFADVDRETGNLSVGTIREVLNSRTKAVICVHLAGWPCDMEPILELSGQHGFVVIEDCAQAHGAVYRGRRVGSIGHVAAWSFCQDKIMTTGGEGGMVTTNDPALWRHMWAMKDHGKSWEAVHERDHAPGFRWLHESFGTNGRMTEIQAALGRIQLRRMAEWSDSRAANAEVITKALQPFAGPNGAVRLPRWGCGICEEGVAGCLQCRHAWYRHYAYVRPENLAQGWTRDRVLHEVSIRGVPCYAGSCSEIYLERAFEGTGWRPRERLPVARELGETSLMFLVHPTLRPDDLGRTVEVLQEVLGRATS